MRIFKSLVGPLAMWLLAVLLLVALVGDHLYRDITVIHEMAADIQRANEQSHRLHDLEMRMRQMVAHAHNFLITGTPEYTRKFDAVAADVRRLIVEARADGIDFSGFGKTFDAIRATAAQMFELPFATGNMAGPILMQEMDAYLARLSTSMTARHHEMDESVNRSMNMASGLQLDMRGDLLVSLLLLLALLGGLTAYGYRRIVRPLVILRREVARIGEGHFSAACPDFGPNEIGELSQALNAMGQAIKQRSMELARAKSLAAYQEKMNAMGLMSAGIAHEVGNPLSAISVSLQVSQRKLSANDIDAASMQIQTALKEVERMESIIQLILNFGRQESGAGMRYFDLKPILDDAIKLAQMSPEKKFVKITKSLPSDIPQAYGSDGVLLQVLVNLIINALNACKEAGEIFICAHEESGGVAIDVSDTGHGIPPEVREDIFKPSFTTKSKGEGTGLGLAISRELINGINGSLQLIENDAKGSCFQVWIPVKGS